MTLYHFLYGKGPYCLRNIVGFKKPSVLKYDLSIGNSYSYDSNNLATYKQLMANYKNSCKMFYDGYYTIDNFELVIKVIVVNL